MSLKASFEPAQGFHPVLHLSIPRTPPPDPSCSLYTLISLPPSFIADRYQLSQLHGEGKLGLEDGILEVKGEGDLEAAVWKAKEARVLIELARNDEEDNGTTEIGVKVPLHMRYQVPDQKRRRRKRDEVQDGRIGKVQVRMDYPRVFWACQERLLDEEPKHFATPCPPSSLSPDFSFPMLSNATLYYTDSPTSCLRPIDPPQLSIELPSGIASDLEFVGPTTVIVIWLGFLYLVWTAFNVWRRPVKERPKPGVDSEREKAE
ncbi:hypothetical protein JCM5353_007617 [Sporobolomyces roseus]